MDISFTPTNTFATANFDILKIDGIDDPLINMNKLATLDFQESYFVSAVEFVCESRNEFTNAKIELYHSINEATSNTVVLESFSDFFVKVKEIISKFLKFLKSLFDRFLNTLMRMIGSEEYLKKHRKDLSNFKASDNFDIEGYKFTFNDSIPLPEAALSFDNSVFDSLYATIGTDLTVENVKNALVNIKLEEDYRQFRGKVINKDTPIDASDFSSELFEVFRDNSSDTEKIEIDFSAVKAAENRFFDYKETKKLVERQYKRVKEAYNTVENQVKELTKKNSNLGANAYLSKLPNAEGITSVEGKTGEDLVAYSMSAELMTRLDIYMKAQIERVQEYSNIHTLAFGAKLDALKACSLQDKSILYTALSRIQRTDAKRKEY